MKKCLLAFVLGALSLSTTGTVFSEGLTSGDVITKMGLIFFTDPYSLMGKEKVSDSLDHAYRPLLELYLSSGDQSKVEKIKKLLEVLETKNKKNIVQVLFSISDGEKDKVYLLLAEQIEIVQGLMIMEDEESAHKIWSDYRWGWTGCHDSISPTYFEYSAEVKDNLKTELLGIANRKHWWEFWKEKQTPK